MLMRLVWRETGKAELRGRRLCVKEVSYVWRETGAAELWGKEVMC